MLNTSSQDTELREEAEDLDGLQGDAGPAVAIDEGAERVFVWLDEALGHAFEEDAREEGDDIAVDLDPAEEAERLGGEDEGMVEGGGEGADGVLEAVVHGRRAIMGQMISRSLIHLPPCRRFLLADDYP